jgi:phage gpG-like protein
MFNVSLIGDADLIVALEAMPGAVRDMLFRAIQRETIGLQQYIKADKLEGQVLKHRSGNLSTSIVTTGPEIDGERVSGGTVSSGDVVHYARIHEYGATVARVSKLGKSYTATYPERSFMRSGLRDQRDHIIEALRAAVMDGVRLEKHA